MEFFTMTHEGFIQCKKILSSFFFRAGHTDQLHLPRCISSLHYWKISYIFTFAFTWHIGVVLFYMFCSLGKHNHYAFPKCKSPLFFPGTSVIVSGVDEPQLLVTSSQVTLGNGHVNSPNSFKCKLKQTHGNQLQLFQFKPLLQRGERFYFTVLWWRIGTAHIQLLRLGGHSNEEVKSASKLLQLL